MKTLLTYITSFRMYALLVFIAFCTFFVIQHYRNLGPELVTTTVEYGDVRNVIAVSGTVHAVNTAELSFPTTGVIESISVAEGQTVLYGNTLATLIHDDAKADYQDAYGARVIAQADLTELLTGIRPEARELSRTKVEIAKSELARITKEQDELVTQAYQTLLSSELVAVPENRNTEDTPPLVSGTYTCDAGVYTLKMYRSGAHSDYSYTLSGLESGTYTAYTESAATMGTCGLSLQFTDGEAYGESTWTITIPNTESASYLTNLHAYNLTKTTRENALRSAEEALKLAEQAETLDVASPRAEALTREEARILQAEARLARASAHIRDHIITAPFEGIITSIGPTVGEVVGNETVITMVSNDAFKITSLIPEIDITKIAVGQKAIVTFDASVGTPLPATVTLISPLARKIEGVSYFEATLILDTPAPWLRGGLNADVDIVIEAQENVLRIPTRFLIPEGDTYIVQKMNGKKIERVMVATPFFGNDGYASIEGVHNGDTIVAP